MRILSTIMLVLMAGCSANKDLIGRLEVYRAVNAAHAKDEALPPKARVIARNAADAFAVTIFELGGPEVSKETRERLSK